MTTIILGSPGWVLAACLWVAYCLKGRARRTPLIPGARYTTTNGDQVKLTSVYRILDVVDYEGPDGCRYSIGFRDAEINFTPLRGRHDTPTVRP